MSRWGAAESRTLDMCAGERAGENERGNDNAMNLRHPPPWVQVQTSSAKVDVKKRLRLSRTELH
jgi:hypothetical protein